MSTYQDAAPATTTAPELDARAAQIRLRQYGECTSTWSTATYDSGTEHALHQIATALLAEVKRLRAEHDRARSAIHDEIADEITASCPEHGPRDEAWMDCHCDVAYEVKRWAISGEAVADA
ncbi:hypothetical protein [Streptomyces buecherae]|uniref:hypothetical protein n=1 Tax=Streptomyces buecherae TaxID=2763006 RepID=UPI0037A4D07D